LVSAAQTRNEGEHEHDANEADEGWVQGRIVLWAELLYYYYYYYYY